MELSVRSHTPHTHRTPPPPLQQLSVTELRARLEQVVAQREANGIEAVHEDAEHDGPQLIDVREEFEVGSLFLDKCMWIMSTTTGIAYDGFDHIQHHFDHSLFTGIAYHGCCFFTPSIVFSPFSLHWLHPKLPPPVLPQAHMASLPHFQLLPTSQFAEWAPTIHTQLNPAKETIVLCHHGVRSMHVANYLVNKGFRNVLNVTGGIDAYSVEADPRVPRY